MTDFEDLRPLFHWFYRFNMSKCYMRFDLKNEFYCKNNF